MGLLPMLSVYWQNVTVILSFISFLLSLSFLTHSSLCLILSGGREDALYLFYGSLGVITYHLYQ